MEILAYLSEYRSVFGGVSMLLMVYILICFLRGLIEQLSRNVDEIKDRKEGLRIESFNGEIGEDGRQNAIRLMVSPDHVDPNPNTYNVISDGGKDVYVRCLTIEKIPKILKFAETLSPLLRFPNSSSTVFVEPIDNESMGHLLDKQINILESEQHANANNTNRVRKLGRQISETNVTLDKVEADDKKFFAVGFLFVIKANSIEVLNKRTDAFRAKALGKKIYISNCAAVQAEALLSNLPLNRRTKAVFNKINCDGVKMFKLDQGAVSCVLDYTRDYYSHKKGVPLGRNLYSGLPFLFDIYEPSHDGFSIIIGGKTRSGKTAMIKAMIERFIPLKYRWVIIDSQTRKGTSEGEYSAVTELNGGLHVKISSDSDTKLNPFDVQESVEWIKESVTSGYERRTLDLNGAITDIVYTLHTLIRDEDDKKAVSWDAETASDIDVIFRETVKELFVEKGIYHGDADSLYEECDEVVDGMLSAGRQLKKLPRISEAYAKIITKRFANTDAKRETAFKLICNNLCEYVEELYYTDAAEFFTRDEYEGLPIENIGGVDRRVYMNDGGIFVVHELHGIRPYFDGQSTVRISRDCPITSFDISQLSEKERQKAREIVVRIVNEQFIKKNSERLDSADKLCVVVDEAHENFEHEYGRKVFEGASRTAAKRNVCMIYATQTIVEFGMYEETRNILRQAAVKMIFKQDGGDRDKLIELLDITESQANIITRSIGAVTNKEDENADRKHKGEVCIVDGEQVTFVKVDLLSRVEALAIEHDVSTVLRVTKRAN